MMSPNIYDVVVVGAGPSGALAAGNLAKAGLKVALIEKQKLPRHKVCGGGVPMSAGHLFKDLAPEAFVECAITVVRHTWNFGDAHLASIYEGATAGPSDHLKVWMVQRPIFDNALTRRAVDAGATLYEGYAVQSITQGTNANAPWTLSASNSDGASQTFETQYVIGADGVNGVTAKAVGLRPQRDLAAAMEVEYPYSWPMDGPIALKPEIMHLEYGALRNGYGWIFPKKDHLNIGAGIFYPKGQSPKTSGESVTKILKNVIHKYLDLFKLPYDPNTLTYRAHPLPIWNGREPLQTSDDRVLLVGDAAGLVGPMFGDGILHALRSGEIAANAIITKNTKAYTEQIHQHFADNLDVARRLSGMLHKFPSLFYRFGVKRPRATRIALRLLGGDLSYTDIKDRVLQQLPFMSRG